MKKTLKELRELSKEDLIAELMTKHAAVDVGYTISFGTTTFSKEDAENLQRDITAFLEEKGYTWTYFELEYEK